MPVNRGPSLRGTSDAIARAVIEDIEATLEREDASRAVARHPLRVAWVEPPNS